MGTRFLHIQNPVPKYKIPQFLKINTGNPVPPHREPVPTYCRTKIYYFYSISNHSYTNYTFRNTKIQPLYIITTSYNIVSSFLLIIRHTNDLNSIIRHKIGFNSINLKSPKSIFLTYPIIRLIPKTHKALKSNEITPYLAMIFDFLGVGFFLSSLLFSNST